MLYVNVIFSVGKASSMKSHDMWGGIASQPRANIPPSDVVRPKLCIPLSVRIDLKSVTLCHHITKRLSQIPHEIRTTVLIETLTN